MVHLRVGSMVDSRSELEKDVTRGEGTPCPGLKQKQTPTHLHTPIDNPHPCIHNSLNQQAMQQGQKHSVKQKSFSQNSVVHFAQFFHLTFKCA